MNAIRFGFAGKWWNDPRAVQQAAYLNKSNIPQGSYWTPVGVEVARPLTPNTPPAYRVATNNEYWQALRDGRIIWTA